MRGKNCLNNLEQTKGYNEPPTFIIVIIIVIDHETIKLMNEITTGSSKLLREIAQNEIH